MKCYARLYLNGWPAFAQLSWLRKYVLPEGATLPAESMQPLEARGLFYWHLRVLSSFSGLSVTVDPRGAHLQTDMSRCRLTRLGILLGFKSPGFNYAEVSVQSLESRQDLNSLLIRESEALREVGFGSISPVY